MDIPEDMILGDCFETKGNKHIGSASWLGPWSQHQANYLDFFVPDTFCEDYYGNDVYRIPQIKTLDGGVSLVFRDSLEFSGIWEFTQNFSLVSSRIKWCDCWHFLEQDFSAVFPELKVGRLEIGSGDKKSGGQSWSVVKYKCEWEGG